MAKQDGFFEVDERLAALSLRASRWSGSRRWSIARWFGRPGGGLAGARTGRRAEGQPTTRS